MILVNALLYVWFDSIPLPYPIMVIGLVYLLKPDVDAFGRFFLMFERQRQRAVITAGKWDKMGIFYQDYLNVFQIQKLNSHFIAVYFPFRNENPVKWAIWAKFAFLKCLLARSTIICEFQLNFAFIIDEPCCETSLWWAHTPRNQIDIWPHKL